MENITFIIKTFERPYCIKRLVRSILKFYPNSNILIGDDSEISCKSYFEQNYHGTNIKVYDLPKDCGLSYGRNYLLNLVNTPYFVLLDDDFVFDKKTNIDKALSILIENDLDILGGYCRNYKIIHNRLDWIFILVQKLLRYELPSNYIGHFNRIDSETLEIFYYKHDFPEYQETEIVLNFFIAKTNSVLNSKWDNDLKLQEHTAFFYNAKQNGLHIAFTNQLSIRHMPIQVKKYSEFRGRNFYEIFMKKNGINKIISHYDDEEDHITILKKD